MRSDAYNLAGRRFGRLTANEYLGAKRWRCQCDCGASVSVMTQSLTDGRTRSCGCFNRERRIELKTTHGQSAHLLFKVWEGMVARCTKPTDKDWPGYGGRGIKVCDAWLKSPTQFFEDMGVRPHGATLDRKDNSKGYGPDNCRWATPMQQGANKRNNALFKVDGETVHFAEICRRRGIPESTLSNRLKSGMSIDDALREPVRERDRTLTVGSATKTFTDWAKDIGVTRKTIQNRIDAGWKHERIVSTPARSHH